MFHGHGIFSRLFPQSFKKGRGSQTDSADRQARGQQHQPGRRAGGLLHMHGQDQPQDIIAEQGAGLLRRTSPS